MSLNIDRSNADPFYRYKMPRLVAKVEGKGNGIKTVIVNMPDIAKALARPPTYPTKFFGCELGAQTQFDLKNERYIVNGSHTEDKLQNLLDGFIKKFVLCPGCCNPETNLIVQSKRGTIAQRCIACGYNGQLDMRHKLTTFILKNPPDQDPNTTTPNKKEKKNKKKGGKDEDGEDEDRASPETTSTTAQEKMAQMRESGKTLDMPPETNANDGDDDEDWGDDFSEEAVKQRMEELSTAAKGLTFTDDLEKSSGDRMNMLYELIKIKRDGHELTKQSGVKEVYAEAERLEVKEKVPMVLVELLLDEKVLAQIKEFRLLFLRFCGGNQKAQKYLLGGIEQLVCNEYPDALMTKSAHILKILYDMDILEEEVIIDWGKKVSKKYVSKESALQMRKEAEVFINWLQEAEEESEEEEEDEEIVYSKTAKVGEMTIEPPKPAAAAVNGNSKPAVEDEDDDDLDIDDI